MGHLYILIGMKNLHAKKHKTLDTVPAGIGQHLRAARKKSGLSSEVAAGRLGMTHTTLNRYENDHREPGASDLVKMAGLYKVAIGALFFGEKGLAAVIPQGIPVRGKLLGRDHFDIDFTRQPQELLPILTIHPHVYAVKVEGSAMGPTAYDGEYLILERPETASYLEMANQAGGLELVRGESVGKVIGIFRRPR